MKNFLDTGAWWEQIHTWITIYVQTEECWKKWKQLTIIIIKKAGIFLFLKIEWEESDVKNMVLSERVTKKLLDGGRGDI